MFYINSYKVFLRPVFALVKIRYFWWTLLILGSQEDRKIEREKEILIETFLLNAIRERGREIGRVCVCV